MMSIKSLWINYFDRSNIHGLRYVVNKEAKLWERIMWTMLLVVATMAILVHLCASCETYSYSSMETIVDDPRYPLSKIDFPAITICSVNKILYSKAKNMILDKYDHDPEQREKYENSLYVLGMLQYPYYKDLSVFIENNSIINIPLNNITDLMLNLMPTIDEMFHHCYWRGSGFNCSDLIRLQRTDEGFCYSFNSKTSERMPNESEINPPTIDSDGQFIPLRNNAAGMMTGFEVILNGLINEYFPKDKRSKGYNIMIHTPEDFPDISHSYKIYSELNISSRISVSVTHVKADNSLKRLNEETRNCFLFEKRSKRDINLPSYRSNAENNCWSLCRLKTTYKVCHCIPCYFKMKGNNTVCGIEHIHCLGKMDVLQRSIKVQIDRQAFPNERLPVLMDNCSCPIPCSFIGYKTEVRHFAKDFIDNTELPNAYMHIDIHYKERFAISYQRSMKYTSQDFLVTFGGMASLFLGCSLVSFLEIIYVIYKSLLILKYKICNKGDTVSKQPHFVLYRHHRSCRFGMPLYMPPNKEWQTVCFNVNVQKY